VIMNKGKKIAELEERNARLKDENRILKNEKIELENKSVQLENETEKLKAEIARLELLNKCYVEQLRLAVARRYGASSERTKLPEQLGLFNEPETIADETAAEPELEEVIIRKCKKQTGRREEFYEGIPTEQIVSELPENERVCPDCGGVLHVRGHEILRREIEIIPATVRAVEYVQTVYTCRRCEKNAADDALPMVKSSVPAPVIPGSGVASPSLLSFIMSNKYVLALPLYRQEQELERIGIHISRQTMANWVIYAAKKWLSPIYNLLRAELLLNDILHADESVLQVVRESGRKASQKSYMWMYHTGKTSENNVALFEYTQTREGRHPLKFLEGFGGFLHVDGYSGYKELENQGVTLIECWAHTRRKFNDALKVLKKEERIGTYSNIGLEYCNKLFELERKFDEMKLTHEERVKQRELQSKHVAEEFFAWAEDTLPKAMPKSKLADALGYAVNQKKWLMNFLLDGRLELSNNRAERTIRPFTVGRKNWLFAFCERGAEASAVVYSIIETAQANGLVPFMYLNYLFEKLPNISKENFADCLPWNPAVQEVCKIPSPSVK